MGELAEQAAQAVRLSGGVVELQGAFEARAAYEDALAASCWRAFVETCRVELPVDARMLVAAIFGAADFRNGAEPSYRQRAVPFASEIERDAHWRAFWGEIGRLWGVGDPPGSFFESEGD